MTAAAYHHIIRPPADPYNPGDAGATPPVPVTPAGLAGKRGHVRLVASTTSEAAMGHKPGDHSIFGEWPFTLDETGRWDLELWPNSEIPTPANTVYVEVLRGRGGQASDPVYFEAVPAADPDYADGDISANLRPFPSDLPDASVMHRTGDETETGTKTRRGDQRFTSGRPWVDVAGFSGVDMSGSGDSRSGVMAALAVVPAGPVPMLAPRGTYRVSKYVPASGYSDLWVVGHAATVAYPSDDLAVVDDATTASDAEARSAFLLMGGVRATFEGFVFSGGQNTDITRNLGKGVYAKTTADLRLLHCTSIGGGLVQQDANPTDRGLRVIGCTTYAWRGPSTPGSDAVFGLNRWEQPAGNTYDRTSNTIGSSHGVYIYAGRDNDAIVDNIFRNVRTNCVKISGTALPIRNMLVSGLAAWEPGCVVEFGDDTASMPFHVNALISDIVAHNPATNRTGWNNNAGVHILGAKGVGIHDVGFYYDRDNLSSPGACYGIAVERQTSSSSPVECVAISDVHMYAQIGPQVGRLARTVTDAVTTNGSPTVASPTANFVDQDQGLPLTGGASIPAGAAIKEVLSATAVVMTANATATATGVTLTITPGATYPASVLTAAIAVKNVGDGAPMRSPTRVGESIIQSAASQGIVGYRDVALVAENLILANPVTAAFIQGCRMPIIRNITLVPGAATSANAQLRIQDCSWPIVYGLHTNGRYEGSAGHSFGVSNNAGGTAEVDFPLLGATGKATPAGGRPEVVMAYGEPTAWTDGDTVDLNGTVFATYHGTSPGAGQFNSMAGLVALINATSGGYLVAADYGADYSPAVTTNHLRIRRAVADAAVFSIKVTCASPLAGVLLSNGTGGGPLDCYSLGGEASAPGTKLVVWSPLATTRGQLTLTADNAAAALLLKTNGYYVANRGGNDSGTGFVVVIGAPAGGEVFRWSITP